MTRRDPILATLLLSLVLAMEGISAPGTVAAGAQSPFSLDPQPAVNQAAPPPNPPAKTSSDSPFSLPPKPDQPPAPTQAAGDSPFSLPSPSPPEVGNTGVAGGQQSVPPPAEGYTAEQLLEQGLELAREGKLEEARVTLEQAVQKDPQNVVALNNLGLVLRKLGRLDGALDTYQKALQIDVTYALTYKNLGVLQEKRGQNELAIQAYREYSRLAPAAPDAKDVSARAEWLEKNRIQIRK